MTIYDHDQIDLFSNDNADLGNFVSINLWLDGFVVFAVVFAAVVRETMLRFSLLRGANLFEMWKFSSLGDMLSVSELPGLQQHKKSWSHEDVSPLDRPVDTSVVQDGCCCVNQRRFSDQTSCSVHGYQ